MADEEEKKVTRVPVNFNYTGLNWDFLKLMAEIPPYADEKYTSFAQYTHVRLEGEKSPENHMAEHLRQYMMDEPYDHFDGDRGRHLVAIAYNAMMEWYYLQRFGPKTHLLKQPGDEPPLPQPRKIVDLMAREADEGLMPVEPESKTDWAEGLAHFRERWKDGYMGARDPGADLRFQAMLWVIDQFDEVARTDDVVLGLIDELHKAAKATLVTLKDPEKIVTQQARMAALDTLRIKIPDMFPAKGSG